MMTCNIICVVLMGVVGDRYDRRRSIAWVGGGLSAVACLGLYYVPGMAGYVPLPPLMTAQAPERTGQVMSTFTLGAGASQALGPLIGTLFIGSIGAQGVMWIYAGLHALSAVLVLFLTPPRNVEEPSTAPVH